MRAGAIAAAMIGAALYYAWMTKQGAGTAGDEDANFLSDAVDDMQSKITGWPAGSAQYQGDIQAAASANGVPVGLLAWLLWKESRYNPAIIDGTRRSAAGAMGIAQFMPSTADDLGIDPLDPAEAIPAAAQYLARLYKARGNWPEALAAYNWGIGNVQRRGLAAAPAETVDYYTTIMAKAGMAAA